MFRPDTPRDLPRSTSNGESSKKGILFLLLVSFSKTTATNFIHGVVTDETPVTVFPFQGSIEIIKINLAYNLSLTSFMDLNLHKLPSCNKIFMKYDTSRVELHIQNNYKSFLSQVSKDRKKRQIGGILLGSALGYAGKKLIDNIFVKNHDAETFSDTKKNKLRKLICNVINLDAKIEEIRFELHALELLEIN